MLHFPRMIIALALIAAGCHHRKVSTPEPTAQSPATSTPATRPAPSGRLTLEQVLAPAGPTEAQNQQVQRGIAAEADRWDSFRREQQAASDRFDALSQQAVREKDQEKVLSLRHERQALMQEKLPRSSQAWERILSSFTADQQRLLEPRRKQGIDALDAELHRSLVRPPATSQAAARPSSQECRVCHMVHYIVAPQPIPLPR